MCMVKFLGICRWTEANLSYRSPRYHSEDACCARNCPETTKPSRTASYGAWPLWSSLSSMSMKMGMRQMTRFSMVSSNWDDSFGSQHLPSAIYALAQTARCEIAFCSHPRRSTFTHRRSVNVAVNGLEPTQDRGNSKLPSA